MTPALAGRTIVVTRPAHQAAPLCDLIEQQGGHAIRFPVLAIREPADQQTLMALLARINTFNLAIFISPNAVEYGLQYLADVGGMPDKVKIAAVGLATAKALQHHHLTVHVLPEQQFNSEALLAMAPMQQVDGQKIIIFRGVGGRELLAQRLRQRGAEVYYAECYQRCKPDSDPAPLLKHWAGDQIDAIIVTSNDGLQNLVDLVGVDARTDLFNTQLLVVSDRTAAFAKQLGFTHSPIIAKKASDQALLQALLEWQPQC